MFGYIRIDETELKVKELRAYQGYYCGLCRELGKYSQISKSMLTYDCTFLYIMLGALTEERPSVEVRRCSGRMLKKRAEVTESAVEYAAAVNVMLAAHKLLDDKADGKKLRGAAFRLIRRDYKKACAKYPALAQEVERSLEEQFALEARRETSIDIAADSFAKLLAAICRNSGVCTGNAEFERVGYHLGRWLYLIDAVDDIDSDKESNGYNPFILNGLDKQSGKERAEYNLYSSLNMMAQAYETLPFVKHKTILDNIIYGGLAHATKAVLSGEGMPKQGRHGAEKN